MLRKAVFFSMLLLSAKAFVLRNKENNDKINWPNEHLLDVEGKISFDGALFNPARADRGPLPTEIFDKHPRLSFLGSWTPAGGIIPRYSWYIQRTLVTQAEARSGCASMGMTLGRPRYVMELDWIGTVTSITDDLSWLDGRNYPLSAGFINNDGSGVTDASIFSHHRLGLVLKRNNANYKMHSRIDTENHYYLCYI